MTFRAQVLLLSLLLTGCRVEDPNSEIIKLTQDNRAIQAENDRLKYDLQNSQILLRSQYRAEVDAGIAAACDQSHLDYFCPRKTLRKGRKAIEDDVEPDIDWYIHTQTLLISAIIFPIAIFVAIFRAASIWIFDPTVRLIRIRQDELAKLLDPAILKNEIINLSSIRDALDADIDEILEKIEVNRAEINAQIESIQKNEQQLALMRNLK